jgi:5-deoxy-glucuronate isomerase
MTLSRVQGVTAMACGRIRKPIGNGWTTLIGGELANLAVAALRLEAGQAYRLATGEREYALVLISGLCDISLGSGLSGRLGPRRDPFQDMPSGLFVGRGDIVTVIAQQTSLIGAGSAPAARIAPPTLVRPEDAREVTRGAHNWQRRVRFVCWTDNTQGNVLIAGETVTPSGNWSTMPPHRHQYDVPGVETAYEEAYFFQFTRPEGFGMIWQFDDAGEMDQAYSLRSGDVAYMSEGYHPTACAPGADLYHLTFIAGPARRSQSAVHKDYRYLLEEENMANPYQQQAARA